MRKTYSPNFKSKVALEAIKGDKTMAEISSIYEVHRVQVQKWKQIALESMSHVFSSNKAKESQDSAKLTDELYKQIGQLKVEVDWLKKKV